jgi:DNA gyrase subunit B
MAACGLRASCAAWKSAPLDGPVLRSGEARRLASHTESLQEVYARPAELVRRDRKQKIYGPVDLLRAILTEGEKGLSLQRYKGLGEMNPNQLWETTLDPEARTRSVCRSRSTIWPKPE